MRIRCLADLEAFWEDNGGATEAEEKLIAHCKAGTYCVLGDGIRPDLPDEGSPPDPQRHIHAEVLRYLILGGCADCRVDEVGVQVMGACVTGDLDLEMATARGHIYLENCAFAQQVNALQADLKSLILIGSLLDQGLNAQGAEITGNVFLRGEFKAKGDVSLSGATIGGQLACEGGIFENPGGDALNAHSAEITGGVFLRSAFNAKGVVRLSGAKIGGQLSCVGGTFENPDGDALDAERAEITSSVFLSGAFNAKGAVSLSGAKIGGQLNCGGGTFENSGGDALNAHSALITGAVFLSKEFIAEGEVCLSGAKIGGQLNCGGGTFENPGRNALNAERMTVSDSFLFRSVEIKDGWVNLTAAHVGDLADDMDSWPGASRLILDGFTYDRIDGDPVITDARRRLEWLAKGDTLNGTFFPAALCAACQGAVGHGA